LGSLILVGILLGAKKGEDLQYKKIVAAVSVADTCM